MKTGATHYIKCTHNAKICTHYKMVSKFKLAQPKKSKPVGLAFFVPCKTAMMLPCRANDVLAMLEMMLTYGQKMLCTAQINDVAPCVNDVMLRINDVELYSNGKIAIVQA